MYASLIHGTKRKRHVWSELSALGSDAAGITKLFQRCKHLVFLFQCEFRRFAGAIVVEQPRIEHDRGQRGNQTETF